MLHDTLLSVGVLINVAKLAERAASLYRLSSSLCIPACERSVLRTPGGCTIPSYDGGRAQINE